MNCYLRTDYSYMILVSVTYGRSTIKFLKRVGVGEHGDRKGSPLRYTLRPPRHTYRSGYGAAPAMQQLDAHPFETGVFKKVKQS